MSQKPMSAVFWIKVKFTTNATPMNPERSWTPSRLHKRWDSIQDKSLKRW